MKLIRLVLLFLFGGLGVAMAQDLKDETLFSIEGVEYDAGTFMKFYFKNLEIVQDDQQKDIDNYLDLYIDYRLKLQQAYNMGLDQKEEYLNEIQSTRSGLAQAFLTDNKVTQQLVREAYERSKQEVNASHILIKVARDASATDTLSAWNRIYELYAKLKNQKADFASLARQKSEGPSAGNAGKLGWFGAFRMVYEFESAAYETEVGDISKPFRTDFGYHIVRVNQKRNNPGEITVAHIMTIDKKEASEKNALERIQEIYAQLEEGQDFSKLARELSDDVNSANRGGKLNKFGTGGIDQTFADAAFAIDRIGNYTKPIQTAYGWHIIKLLEKHPIKSFEEQEKALKEKIQKAPRSRKITESFVNTLKDKYGLDDPMILPQAVKELVNDSLLLNNAYVFDPAETANEQVLFSIEDKRFTYADFLKFVAQQQKKVRPTELSASKKLDLFYQNYLSQQLVAYYDRHLERDNEDFAFLYDEFKEGFLIFDLIEAKVWNRAKNDSLGQMKFYKAHRDQYQWKRRLDLVLTQSTNKEIASQVQHLLKQGIPTDSIKARFNKDNRVQVIVSKGVVEETYNRLPKDFKIEKGVSQVYHDQGDSFYKVILVNEIKPSEIKSFEEARGAVVNDYQQELEAQWLANLRKGKEISIDKSILKKVKKQIEKSKGA